MNQYVIYTVDENKEPKDIIDVVNDEADAKSLSTDSRIDEINHFNRSFDSEWLEKAWEKYNA